MLLGNLGLRYVPRLLYNGQFGHPVHRRYFGLQITASIHFYAHVFWRCERTSSVTFMRITLHVGFAIRNRISADPVSVYLKPILLLF